LLKISNIPFLHLLFCRDTIILTIVLRQNIYFKEVNMKKYKVLLSIALILCLISSIGACLIQTNFGAVTVTEVTIPGSDGTNISGLLYKPDKATADNPLPLIITGHGSFNNKEMQDQNLIELSRRGFIVFAPDSYRHGKSSIHNENMGEYASMVDSVEALYHLNYIDKNKIAVTGHSMGADQTNNTVRYYIEQAATGQGINKISAALSVGCDPPYASYETEGLDEPTPVAVDYGVIQAKYDEWFFKQADVNMDPAQYLNSENARAFINEVGVNLTQPVESDKVYTGTINGETYKRVIYQNTEIHPLNHFSLASAADEISFFYEVFGVPNGYTHIDASNQIWLVKEIFNLIGLVGIFMFLLPFSVLMLRTKFFSEIITDGKHLVCTKIPAARDKINFAVVLLINTAIPALLLIPVGFKLIGQESFVPAVYNKIFGEANTNELTAWSIAVALCILAVLLINNYLVHRAHHESAKDWGIRVSVKQFFKALLLALITVFSAYMVLFILNYFFNTDFRIWVIAVKTFDPAKIRYALVYVPAFIIFYLLNSITVNVSNNVEGWKEWQKLLVSCMSNILGLVVLIVIQYSALIHDGTIVFNAMRIVNLFPLLALIPAATVISRKYFKETNNIYLGSFVFGIFYAMITVANTMFLAI